MERVTSPNQETMAQPGSSQITWWSLLLSPKITNWGHSHVGSPPTRKRARLQYKICQMVDEGKDLAMLPLPPFRLQKISLQTQQRNGQVLYYLIKFLAPFSVKQLLTKANKLQMPYLPLNHLMTCQLHFTLSSSSANVK